MKKSRLMFINIDVQNIDVFPTVKSVHIFLYANIDVENKYIDALAMETYFVR